MRGGGRAGESRRERATSRRQRPLVRVICIPPLVLVPLPVLTLSVARPGGGGEGEVHGVVLVLVLCTAAALLSLYCTLILDPGFIRGKRQCHDEEMLVERYADDEENDGNEDALVAAMRRGKL